MLSPILALYARISELLWLKVNIHSTGAEVADGTEGFFSNGWFSILSKFHASWVTNTESPRSQVSRPRLRERLEGSETKTKTLRFQDQDQDSEVQDQDRDQDL